uniref:NXPE family member 3-like n=1 Tax=Saccoglossus kowalevskii TaxID=10224 RepID=A0ABM0LXH4_SACKO|nr:PREDICTED: NXPE family member 3-like [Saccoglossus kowalevskii]
MTFTNIDVFYPRSDFLMKKLTSGPNVIKIANSPHGRVYEDNLPYCESGLQQPITSGYWQGDIWHSLLCKLTQWQKVPMITVKECLQGKDMYFLGDSTTRQFSNVVVELFGLGSILQKRHAARTYRKVTEPTYNISFTFQHHPWAVGGSPYPINEVKFEVDVIDNLRSAECNYVVLVGPYAHYTSWSRESYVERLQLLKEALLRFKQRCPGSDVFIKGSKPRDHNVLTSYIHSNDFYLFEMNVLMRKIFHGIGAIFLDVWDMNLSYPAPNNIHMPMEVIRQEVNTFLSYLCKI